MWGNVRTVRLIWLQKVYSAYLQGYPPILIAIASLNRIDEQLQIWAELRSQKHTKLDDTGSHVTCKLIWVLRNRQI